MDKIIVSFKHDFCFRSVKYKSFTNCLEDINSFVDNHRKIFSELIPMVTKYNITELRPHHTHPIGDDKRSLVLGILREIIKAHHPDLDTQTYVNQNGFEMETLYQLSFNAMDGVRLIGYLNGCVFTVLFVDYHHLIYPSQKGHHNRENYLAYSYCPMRGDD